MALKFTGAATKEYICAGCGKSFSIPASDTRHYTYKMRNNKVYDFYCSYTCYSKAQKKPKRVLFTV